VDDTVRVGYQYSSAQGEPIATSRLIEQFSLRVSCNVCVQYCVLYVIYDNTQYILYTVQKPQEVDFSERKM